MAKTDERIQRGILGDINPVRGAESEPSKNSEVDREQEDAFDAMEGGSRHDRTRHPGSRDVTEGVTGGVGTETGGTRNYRQGTGATGGDIGNRPE